MCIAVIGIQQGNSGALRAANAFVHGIVNAVVGFADEDIAIAQVTADELGASVGGSSVNDYLLDRDNPAAAPSEWLRGRSGQD